MIISQLYLAPNEQAYKDSQPWIPKRTMDFQKLKELTIHSFLRSQISANTQQKKALGLQSLVDTSLIIRS